MDDVNRKWSRDPPPEMKRKLSRREKKELKKQEKQNRAKGGSNANDHEAGVATKLYAGWSTLFRTWWIFLSYYRLGTCYSSIKSLSHITVFVLGTVN